MKTPEKLSLELEEAFKGGLSVGVSDRPAVQEVIDVILQMLVEERDHGRTNPRCPAPSTLDHHTPLPPS